MELSETAQAGAFLWDCRTSPGLCTDKNSDKISLDGYGSFVRVFLAPPARLPQLGSAGCDICPNSLSGKAWGLAGFSLTKSFPPFGSKQPEFGYVPSALGKTPVWGVCGRAASHDDERERKAPVWLRLEGSGCSQCYWGPFGWLSWCQELRPWLLLWPPCVILSQVAPRPELTQCCRADPKDIIVCGKAPRNFTTHWTCSLDLPAANQLMLTFVVVSNQTRSLRVVWAHVYVLAQFAISARIFICLGPSADRGSGEQTCCVLHSAPETGRRNSGETCCIF